MKKIAMILLVALMISALSVPAFAEADKPFAGTELTVYNWYDYIDPEVLDIFEEESGIQVSYVNFSQNEDMYTRVSTGAGSYDVIIGVHAPLAGRLATIKSQLPGVKTIGWVHNSFEALFGAQFRYIGAGRKRHYVYQFRRLDHVVLLCHHDADMYQAYDPLFTPTVIYNPLTLTPGQRSDGTSKRFLAVGRFSRQHKGFDLLIEAFHLFAQHNSLWTLDIVGEGREENLLRELIRKYQLESRVTIHPFTTNIQQYYSQAQVYVLSSRWEGFGLVLVEAMAHGLPVVSSDLPTSLEIMGDFGLYFKNGDISSLAQQLEAATRLDWPSLSGEALVIARRFDISHIIERWKALID